MAAFRTDPHWLRREEACPAPARFIKNAAAAVTFQKSFPPFDGNEGDEEKAQIIVQAFKSG
jgi:hypothetical protein